MCPAIFDGAFIIIQKTDDLRLIISYSVKHAQKDLTSKEVERRLYEKNVPISPARVAELTRTMYSITMKIPETNQWETIPFKWTPEQKLIK
jgi:hypothetical protein